MIFAGGEYYSADDIKEIIRKVRDGLESNANWKKLDIPSLGSFSFSKVHATWSKLLMLGAYDYFKVNEVDAWQILPNDEYRTLDIPDLSTEFNETSEPVWKWLVTQWDYAVPKDSTVVTNLASLKGEKVTEVMRWEESEWEMFVGAGPDVPKEEMRVVSLGTLLGIDQTLSPSINLSVGKGLWRDPVKLVWNDWG